MIGDRMPSHANDNHPYHITDFHLNPPQTAANDNTPGATPIEWETNLYEYDGDDLVAALEEDEALAAGLIEEKKLPAYSAAMHEEKHRRYVRRAAKAMPTYTVNAEDEVIRFIDAKRMREWLGADADVLDMATEAGVTYRDIGRHIGTEGSDKTAERAGKQEVKDVAKIFWDRAS
jgi:hypothetical protein